MTVAVIGLGYAGYRWRFNSRIPAAFSAWTSIQKKRRKNRGESYIASVHGDAARVTVGAAHFEAFTDFKRIAEA